MDMTTRSGLILLIVILCTSLGIAQVGETITMETLLNEMTNRGSLAEWPSISYTCKQASSYSRNSKTKSTIAEDAKYKTGNFGDENVPRDWGQGWFENHDFDQYIRTEINNGRKEDVMFEDHGAGVIVRFWSTYGELATDYGGIYRIYIDGNPNPVIEMHNLNFAGKEGLIGKPFSFFAPENAENPMWRGRNLILPIPYAKSCKITYDGAQKYSHLDGWRGHYYQINYRTYKPSTQVESFNKGTISKYNDQIKVAGEKLMENAISSEEHVVKNNVVLNPGKSLTLNLKGEKAIKYINTRIKASNQEQALRSTILKIEFDGHPTVWCPIGQFYGLGYRQLTHRTHYINTTETGNMNAFWVMPFSTKAKISLVNHGTENLTVEDFQIGYEDYVWTENTMYFHATWKETKNLTTELRSDYNFIAVKGRGVFVGDNLTIFNYFPDRSGINWWGEGDEKIYVDGEDFPSHFGTGTEDYYCYAWCRPQPFSAPIASQPIGDGNKTPGNTSNNRYRLLDAIPFTTDFTFDMEIWHPHRGKMDYSPATFFYAFPGSEWNVVPDVNGVKQKVTIEIEDNL